jgi:rSAM/selenodomain-associated transferase 2
VRVSIIVPVLNEAEIIGEFLEKVRLAAPASEIIVVDGGSSDATLAVARPLADQTIAGPHGRARQMNTGALRAHGQILWFLHADSTISATCLAAIDEALSESAVAGGCFRLEIDSPRRVYRVRDAIGNLCVDLFQIALGDRGLFCRKENFLAIGGYPNKALLEDADFYCKLRRSGRVRQVPVTIQTSARRYEALGPIRTSLFYLLIMILYFARVKRSILERMVDAFMVSKATVHQRSVRQID